MGFRRFNGFSGVNGFNGGVRRKIIGKRRGV